MTFLHRLAHRIARLKTSSLLALTAITVACSQGERADFLSPVPTSPSTSLKLVRIDPRIAASQAGSEFRFRATAFSEAGAVVPVLLDWTAESGTISSDGRYIGVTPGPYRIVVRAHDRPDLSDTAVVAVWQNETDPTGVLIQPASITLQEGDTLTFGAFLNLAGGAMASGALVSWAASGGHINSSGRFTASTPGTYVITAQTPNGYTGTATVVVTSVAGVGTKVTIDPKTARVGLSQGLQFTPTTMFSTGQVGPAVYEWKLIGSGSITQSGAFLAGGQEGDVKVIVTAPQFGLADTAIVTVANTSPSLTSLSVVPKPVSVSSAGSVQFAASGNWSSGANTQPLVSWSATGGTIGGDGLYVAGSVGGTYRVVAQQQGGSLADTAVVTVQPPTVLVLALSPRSPSLPALASQQFTASAVWSNGSTALPAVTWSATGGTISASGLYTAGATSGTYKVKVSIPGRADSTFVTVGAPMLTTLSVSPKPVQLQTGSGQQFSAAGTWSDGSTSLPTLTWSATGGSITQSGFYTAGNTPGSYRVIVSGGGKADTSTVTLASAPPPPPQPTLASLTLSPKSISLATSGTQQFNTSALWSDGGTALPTLTWSSTGGSVSASGLYTAGTIPGSYRVIASGGGKADTAAITVSASAPPPPSQPPPSAAAGCSNPQPGYVWCDDFEQDRSASYFEFDNAGGSLTRTAGVGTSGSSGMRARWSQGQVNAGNLKLALGRTPSSYMRAADNGTSNYRELYWRIYLRNQSGWIGGGADKLSRATILANSNWAQAMIAHVWSGGSGNSYLMLDPASGTDLSGSLKTTTYNDSPNLRWLGSAQSQMALFSSSNVGQWHCVESHVRLNTAGLSDGTFELWIDGSLQAQRTGLNWVGSYNGYGLNAVFLENYWNGGSPVAQERYLDDFVVSTQPIGCEGTNSQPPTPPSPPPPATVNIPTMPVTPVATPGTSSVAIQTHSVSGASEYRWTGGSNAGGNGWSGTTAAVNTSIARPPAGSHWVCVRAANSAGESDPSCNSYTVQDAATPPPPSGPVTLTSLTIGPRNVSLLTGTTQLFTASALWSDGSTTLPSLSWNSTGGLMLSGLYTAGTRCGNPQCRGVGRRTCGHRHGHHHRRPFTAASPPPDGSVTPDRMFDPDNYTNPSTFLADSRATGRKTPPRSGRSQPGPVPKGRWTEARPTTHTSP